MADKYEYKAVSDQDADELANKVGYWGDTGWELVTITSVGAVIEGVAIPNHWAFLRRIR